MDKAAVEIKLFGELCVSFNGQGCLERSKARRGVWIVKDALVLYRNMEKKIYRHFWSYSKFSFCAKFRFWMR